MPESEPSSASQEQFSSNVDRKAILTLMLINFVDLMGFGLVLLLLPFYAIRFEAAIWQIALMQAVYPLCAFISSPILGAWSDRVGRRPVLIFSQWGSVLGYLVLALSVSVAWTTPGMGLMLLFFSRVIDGLSAGNVTITNAYIADVVPPANRAATNGMLGAAFGLGFTFGPPIGGILGHFDHALPGLLAAILSATASVMVWKFLPESHTNRQRTAASAYPFSRERIAMVKREPMVGYLALIWFITMLAYTTLETSVPLILKNGLGYAELQAGLFMGAIGLIIVFVQGGLVRPLKKRIGEWPMAMLGATFGIVGMLIYVRVAIAPSLTILAVAAIANAFGRSLKTPTLSSILSQNTSPTTHGSAYGIYQGMGSLGRVFGPGIVALMYDRHCPAMFGVGAALIATAATLLFLIRPGLKSSRSDSAKPDVRNARIKTE